MKRSQNMVIDDKHALTPRARFQEFRTGPDWESKTLGELATISAEKVGENECVPMSITSGVGLVSQMAKFGRVIAGRSYRNYLLLRKNDFAYNKSATKEYPEGFIALYSGESLAAVPNSIFTCFRIKGDSPTPEYLNYLFQGNLHGKWLKKFIEVSARAHGSLSVDEDDLLALRVPLPSGSTSLAEQRKIAKCLSTLDELIVATSQKLDALKTHKKTLMLQLFPRDGETRPRLRFPEFRNAPDWINKRLEEIAPLQRGFDLPSSELMPGDVPVVYSNGVRSYHKAGMAKGPGLVTGRSGTIGKLHYIENGEYWPHNTTLWVTTFKGNDPLFIYYLYSRIGLDRFASGSGVPTLNRNDVHAFESRIPSDTEEQHRIATCLSSLDDMIAAQAQKHEALKNHKKGLMQQLFPSPAEIVG